MKFIHLCDSTVPEFFLIPLHGLISKWVSLCNERNIPVTVFMSTILLSSPWSTPSLSSKPSGYTKVCVWKLWKERYVISWKCTIVSYKLQAINVPITDLLHFLPNLLSPKRDHKDSPLNHLSLWARKTYDVYGQFHQNELCDSANVTLLQCLALPAFPPSPRSLQWCNHDRPSTAASRTLEPSTDGPRQWQNYAGKMTIALLMSCYVLVHNVKIIFQLTA